MIHEDEDLLASELEADEGSLFYKVRLDERHLPKSYAYRECRVCGKRLYKDTMVLRMRNYRNNYYCQFPILIVLFQKIYKGIYISFFSTL